MAHQFTVTLSQIVVTTWAQDSDTAVNMVLEAERAPFESFISVYQDNPVPEVNGRFGAPMGRMGGPLDHDGIWRADPVDLDEGGYDAGGAYWGLRRGGERLFAVQDGMGNIAFVDAPTQSAALQIAGT